MVAPPDRAVDGWRRMGLVVLSTDPAVEADVAALMPAEVGLHVSRVAFANPTTPENPRAMLPQLAAAADLILPGLPLAALGFGCTSGAGTIGHARLDAALAGVRPGVPVATSARGAVDGLRHLLASGSAAATPHLTRHDRPLRAGEAAFFEVSGCLHRRHCPLSCTIILGRPSQACLDAEAAVPEGKEAGLAVARAGNACEDVATAHFAVLERRGIAKDNRSGYPIGLGCPPDRGERTCSFRRGDRTGPAPGMTFHFTTGHRMVDWGLEITESVLITDDAPECPAKVPRKLFARDCG